MVPSDLLWVAPRLELNSPLSLVLGRVSKDYPTFLTDLLSLCAQHTAMDVSYIPIRSFLVVKR